MAMYVMTVVPDPARVMAEMRRVVKAGRPDPRGQPLRRRTGPRRHVGRLMRPLSRLLGWNTTISAATLAALPGTRLLSDTAAGLGGFYRLLTFEVVK